MYAYFKSLSLNQLAAMSGGKITPSMLARAQYDLAAISVAPASDDPQGAPQSGLAEPQ
jgi:uncharacterized protein with GYD domain